MEENPGLAVLNLLIVAVDPQAFAAFGDKSTRSSHLHTADVELLERARRGQAEACDELVERFGPRLYGLARSMLGHEADAEDMVQETLLAALEKGDSFAGRSSLWTWLSGVLVNRIGKHRRSRRVRKAASLDQATDEPSAPPPMASGASPAAAVQQRVDVMAMLATLSSEHRQVLVLREMEGLSYQEIAKGLNLPLGTVESRISRARSELRTRFAEYLA